MRTKRKRRLPPGLRDLDRKVRRHGWYLARRSGSGHYIYRHPRVGTPVVVSGSPSDYRAHKNAWALMRRLLREAKS